MFCVLGLKPTRHWSSWLFWCRTDARSLYAKTIGVLQSRPGMQKVSMSVDLNYVKSVDTRESAASGDRCGSANINISRDVHVPFNPACTSCSRMLLLKQHPGNGFCWAPDGRSSSSRIRNKLVLLLGSSVFIGLMLQSWCLQVSY